jgi:hypothetical protein
MATSIDHVIKPWADENGFLKQTWPFTPKCRQMMHDACSSSTLTPSAHIVGVTAKECCVVLDPLEDGALIPKGCVWRASFLFYSLASEETKRPELVIMSTQTARRRGGKRRIKLTL